MTLRVLIIPEDPTLDQYVLKPVVEKIFQDLECPARVDVLRDPHISGIAQALNPEVVRGIIDDNRMTGLFLLLVDRDCDRYSNQAKASQRQSEHEGRLIATLAHQEVEVWALALHRDELGASWGDVRAECDPKETFFDPFIERKRWLDTVGKGRTRAMRELCLGWRGLLQVCPEVAGLQEAIGQWLSRRGLGHCP